MTPPTIDPTPIFELFRGNYGTELLTAAVAHFDVFGRLSKTPMPLADLGEALGLAERPTVVLATALRAFGLLTDVEGKLHLTALACEHLLPGGRFDVGDYVSLAANSPGVLAMVDRLKTNRPAEHGSGVAFIYREGVASAMENEAAARHFTLALAGRAKNVAPILAQKVALSEAKLVVDVGGGTGIYSIAFLRRNPNLRAVVLDRPEVLKVARELAEAFGVTERLTLQPCDMFRDPMPGNADVVLLSNILHDWDVPECRALIARCAGSLRTGGQLLIHDVFLNDALDGPLPMALYSAALFTLTEGRLYSAGEYRAWLRGSGLAPGAVVPTLIHCGVLASKK
ncbi:MAG: methyltransferase domain-containing protein [Planctomycetes bacterium]|nr:methyltransferase domain-containing protein [Planctomycetota bacterium]